MLVYSAADFEDFVEPRPEIPQHMEVELERVVRHLMEARWPFRMHATYDETIDRALNVFERINRDVPFAGLNWFFDHAETISPRNIDRVQALGGGIAIQHRMAYQGEDFAKRYGADLLAQTPPIRRMLAAGVPVGAGTDATRVASYNPWISLYWLVTGKTIGGMSMYSTHNRLDRTTALRAWTEGNTWFSNEQGTKGSIRVGQLADAVALSSDYMIVDDEGIRNITSMLTLLGGNIVFADGPFSKLSPEMPPASPDWSPVNKFGGYYASSAAATSAAAAVKRTCLLHAPRSNSQGDALQAVTGRQLPSDFGCHCWIG
jgi:predicted amidohydrolase YtcJ